MAENDEYMKKVIFFDKGNQYDQSLFAKECENHTFVKEEKKMYSDRAKQAFELAHDIRKFEIELFWKRGTYFWAFILGIYTAYFYMLSIFVKDEKGCKTQIIDCLCCLPEYGKFILFLLSFLGFFFCLSWVLVNKGSKFWQENWEAHIDVLEDEFSGRLYKTFLTTKDTEQFSKCCLNLKPYNYSVSKISTSGSIILSCVAFIIFAVHLYVLVYIFTKKLGCECHVTIFSMLIVLILLCIKFFFIEKCKGSLNNDKKYHWTQREVEQQGILSMAKQGN